MKPRVNQLISRWLDTRNVRVQQFAPPKNLPQADWRMFEFVCLRTKLQ